MKNLLNKFLTKEIILYIIFGLLTTVVNLVAYSFFIALDFSAGIANIPAWIIAVLFAYVTNKVFVFESNSHDVSTIFKELLTFTNARLITFFLEEAIIVGSTIIWPTNFAEYASKCVALVLVTILNYIISKLIVFKNKNGNTK